MHGAHCGYISTLTIPTSAHTKSRFSRRTTKWHGMIMPRVFRTRSFERSMRRSTLTDEALCRAVDEMRRGLIDASLGGGVFKKRVALPGRGKRGSVRTLIATQRGSHWFFLFGYEKNQRATISSTERDLLLGLATDLFGMSGAQIASALMSGELYEICRDQDP